VAWVEQNIRPIGPTRSGFPKCSSFAMLKTMKLLTLPLAMMSVAALFCSCASHQVPFNEAAFVRSAKAGTGDVTGRVFRTDTQDEIWIQTHWFTVKLIPANAYTDEIVQRKYKNREWLARADKRMQKYVRKSRTDHDGNFSFYGAPAGGYYVVCHYKWNYPTDSTDGDGNSITVMADDDQWIYARANVQRGNTTHILGWDQGR
jgi:hypothetical protein